MSKEVKEEADFKPFFTTCEQQLSRLEQCVSLPEDYTNAGLGRPNNEKDLLEITAILKFILEEKNKQTIIENLNNGQSTRWKYTESGLKITIIIKLALSGRVHLTFDFNSKFLEAKTNKIIAAGGQSKVKSSAELIQGLDIIQATVTSSSRKQNQDSVDRRLREKELLKVILSDNPFFTEIVYGDVHDGKINSTAPRMQMDLYNLIYPSTEKSGAIDKLTKLKLADVLWIIFALIRGVNILHKKGILHRDLKLANILVHKNQHGHWCVYITDPGAAAFEKDAKEDKTMYCTYRYAAHDNPIWLPFAQAFAKVKKSEANFWKVLNSMDYAGYQPFVDVTKSNSIYFPVISALLHSFLTPRPITFQTSYADQKEDLWQLSNMLSDTISWFKKVNNLAELPKILQDILNRNFQNQYNDRDERDTVDDLENYFLRQPDSLNDYAITELFQQQSEYYGIDMPIGSLEQKKTGLPLSESKYNFSPKIFVPLSKQIQIDQIGQFIVALKEFRYELIKESKKIETNNFLTVINKLTKENDEITREVDMVTWIIASLGKNPLMN